MGCDPITTPKPLDCTVRSEALFTTTNQLDFTLTLSESVSDFRSFTLRNDACRAVRFNYLTDVNGEDASAFTVHPPPAGLEPWIATRDSIEVTVVFQTLEPGLFDDAWIEIRYSYPLSENTNDVGVMERIFLSGESYP
jgi:hypothetical protein